MKKTTLFYLLFLPVFATFAQTNMWTESPTERSSFVQDELYFRKAEPTAFTMYNLEIIQMQKLLRSVSATSTKEVMLPTINGKVEAFNVKEASVLALELAAKYPMIKSYVGQGVNNPTMTARFSLGTDGLHVVIYSGKGESFYIDAYTKNNESYIAYNRSSLENKGAEFQCLLDGTEVPNATQVLENSIENANDGQLRTYRLALACSAEYSIFHLDNQGIAQLSPLPGRLAAVLSAMNTSMTRINGVYERDLGVRMEIVANNDQVIFFNAASDGITDGTAGTMINQVQTICDAEIGDANYDIGHIFSTGGSGLAGLGVVCVSGQKARGVTGIATPMGDPYDIDYVAHEMGHQFGATHTQNNDCNRTDSTAVEPGSATTIMGYAGICPPNVQTNSDDHFHSVSIAQMWATIQSSASCATLTATNNAAPTANAGADYTIPLNTPFVLKGQGTDSDTGNVLSYNWEQIDPEVAPMNGPNGPLSNNTEGPTFRSFPSTTSPNRYMPSLATIVAGNTASSWDVLPSAPRDMNFSLVVRDNHPGGGSSASDNVKISTMLGNSFRVTSQNTAVTWNNGATETIIWSVSGSDLAPVNCQNVNIKLSLDGGISFPIVLAANTPNDGSETITVPNNGTTQARIMVEAADNIFYNVNTTAFTINGATASVEDFNFGEFSMYPNPTNGTFNVNFKVIDTDAVSVELFDVRGRVIHSKKYLNTAVNFSEKISFKNTTPGLYLVKITNGNKQTTRKLVIK